jgi:acetyl-CoA acetyltransferase
MPNRRLCPSDARGKTFETLNPATEESLAQMAHGAYGIGRDEQDEFAANSQQKAERAVADGVFKEKIVPIEVLAKGGTRLVDTTSTRGLARRPRAWASCGQRSAATAEP